MYSVVTFKKCYTLDSFTFLETKSYIILQVYKEFLHVNSPPRFLAQTRFMTLISLWVSSSSDKHLVFKQHQFNYKQFPNILKGSEEFAIF